MKRLNIFLLAVFIGCCSIIAQTTTETGNLFNPENVIVQLSPVSYQSTLPLTVNHEKKDNNPSIKGIISGVIIVAAGTVLSLNGYYKGQDHYSRYKKSAFTENTDRIRRKVIYSNLKCVGGGIIAGTGLMLTIFSF